MNRIANPDRFGPKSGYYLKDFTKLKIISFLQIIYLKIKFYKQRSILH